MKYLKVRIILFFFGMSIPKARFEELRIKQFDKGFQKYGETLEDQKYDYAEWQEMAVEELIDFLEYAKKYKQPNEKM